GRTGDRTERRAGEQTEDLRVRNRAALRVEDLDVSASDRVVADVVQRHGDVREEARPVDAGEVAVRRVERRTRVDEPEAAVFADDRAARRARRLLQERADLE